MGIGIIVCTFGFEGMYVCYFVIVGVLCSTLPYLHLLFVNLLYLLYAGHSIQDATEDGESLLSLACSAGYYELAEVLLRMKASVEDRGVKGEPVTGYRELAAVLLKMKSESGADTGVTGEKVAVYTELVDMLFTLRAKVKKRGDTGELV